MSQANPWEEFSAKHHRGEHITSRVSRVVLDMGLLVALEGGIDGIVHLKDLDWTIPGERAIKRYKVGDSVEAVILSIQPEHQRISLRIKQIRQNPRRDADGDPPAPVPVRPGGPRPKPQSAEVQRD